MTSFQIKRQIEMDVNYQGITLTEFSISADDNIGNDQIIDTFIRSCSFNYDSLRDCVKKEPDKGYLRQVFNIDKIKIADFKKHSKVGVTNFLCSFINRPEWGDDRNEFAKLLNWYFEIHDQFGDNDFYVISKEWFDKDDERVIEPESWIYSYYFLIISVDRNLNLLTLTEWSYD